ncbi:MAG: hypothetical protein ACQER7_08070 [Bacteroidota bacterium]
MVYIPLHLCSNTSLVIKIEILVVEEHVSEVIAIIRKNARTDYRGDGHDHSLTCGRSI